MLENITTQYACYTTGTTIRALKKNGLISAYSGIYTDPDAWTKCLVLVYDANQLQNNKYHISFLRNIEFEENSKLVFSHLIEEENKHIYIFNLKPEGQYIMDKVWAGKYSELPSDYKNTFFNKHLVVETADDVARKNEVVFKTNHLKKLIEKKLNTKIDPFNELEKKPLLREEIYNHPMMPTEEEIERTSYIEEALSFIQKLNHQSVSERFADLHEHYQNNLKEK